MKPFSFPGTTLHLDRLPHLPGRHRRPSPSTAPSLPRAAALSRPASRLLPAAVLVLIVSLLWIQAASADETLLRGPRKASRASSDASSGGQGALEKIASAPVLFYQRFLGPHWGRRCAYYPSCSHYALLAIQRHGAAIGSVMAFDRLQHEADEARFSPLIRASGEIKVYDPLENNDYWWYTGPYESAAQVRAERAEGKTKP